MSESLDDYHAHEALDRAGMMVDILSDHLAEHPFVLAHPHIKARVDAGVAAIADAYQMIGSIHLMGKP
jgi:hypothetical protein